VALHREPQGPDEEAPEPSENCASHFPLFVSGPPKVSLEPAPQLFQIRKGEGLHLQAAQVVVPPRPSGPEGDVDLVAEESGCRLQGDGHPHRAVSRLDPVELAQGVEADRASPLVAALQGIEEAVPPELGDQVDPDGKPRFQGTSEPRGLQDGPQAHLYPAGGGVHLEGQGILGMERRRAPNPETQDKAPCHQDGATEVPEAPHPWGGKGEGSPHPSALVRTAAEAE
jgi:hypothetical protein